MRAKQLIMHMVLHSSGPGQHSVSANAALGVVRDMLADHTRHKCERQLFKIWLTVQPVDLFYLMVLGYRLRSHQTAAC